MSHDHLISIEARLNALGEGPWEVVTLSDGHPGFQVTTAVDGPLLLRVTRESQPANADDVQFIAHAPEDLRRLLNHVRGERRCSAKDLDVIKTRAGKASRPPWKAFLKSKGGVGGDSVIRVSEEDDEPDLYLWIDSEPAPDVYFEFVAAARQDVLELLEEAQSGHVD